MTGTSEGPCRPGWSRFSASARTSATCSGLPRTSSALLRGSTATCGAGAPSSPPNTSSMPAASSAASAFSTKIVPSWSPLPWSSWRAISSIRATFSASSVTTSALVSGSASM